MMLESPIRITAGRSAGTSPAASNTSLKKAAKPCTSSVTIRGVTVCQPSGSLIARLSCNLSGEKGCVKIAVHDRCSDFDRVLDDLESGRSSSPFPRTDSREEATAFVRERAMKQL